MPDIKYQVFISSTYADLVEERQAVSRAILDMGHIPAGMEMFPAADVEQLTYIKKVIDECDYYVLIIGARYGSLDAEGVSFTEREYDYAVQTGKTVLAFVHANMDEIPRGKTDKDEAKYKKLIAFKEKVSGGRLVMFWRDRTELTAQSILSLTKAFASNPQVGWVRGDTVPSESRMADMLKLREENERLRATVSSLQASTTPKFEDAAGIDETVNVTYSYYNDHGKRGGSQNMTYAEFLRLIAPSLHTPKTLDGAVWAVRKGLLERYAAPERSMTVREATVQDALLHLVATGHVKMWPGKAGDQSVTAYQLTDAGVRVWQEMSYVRRSEGEEAAE